MYQQRFKPTPLFDRLVRPFIEKLPTEPGKSITIMYPPTRTFDSVRLQWYNYFFHHVRGLYALSFSAGGPRDRYWRLIITRVVEEEEPNEQK